MESLVQVPPVLQPVQQAPPVEALLTVAGFQQTQSAEALLRTLPVKPPEAVLQTPELSLCLHQLI